MESFINPGRTQLLGAANPLGWPTHQVLGETYRIDADVPQAAASVLGNEPDVEVLLVSLTFSQVKIKGPSNHSHFPQFTGPDPISYQPGLRMVPVHEGFGQGSIRFPAGFDHGIDLSE